MCNVPVICNANRVENHLGAWLRNSQNNYIEGTGSATKIMQSISSTKRNRKRIVVVSSCLLHFVIKVFLYCDSFIYGVDSLMN